MSRRHFEGLDHSLIYVRKLSIAVFLGKGDAAGPACHGITSKKPSAG